MMPTTAIEYVYDDGGREQAGFKGETGDCAVRAAAIATGLPYGEVYDKINELAKLERPRKSKRSNARTGVHSRTLARFLEGQDFYWFPTMAIGSGCTTHLRTDELPQTGNLIVSLSKHYAAVIDGVLHDNHDSSREGTRCVYGYWRRQPYCEDCSHHHELDEPCLCPDCGDPVPCNYQGGSH
jgi:hypothetical protein